jgi:hypothetical protein
MICRLITDMSSKLFSLEGAMYPCIFRFHFWRAILFGTVLYDFGSQDCRFEPCRLQIKFQSHLEGNQAVLKQDPKNRCYRFVIGFLNFARLSGSTCADRRKDAAPTSDEGHAEGRKRPPRVHSALLSAPGAVVQAWLCMAAAGMFLLMFGLGNLSG